MIDRETLGGSAPSTFSTESLNNFLLSFGLNPSTLFPGVFASKKMMVCRTFNSPHRILRAKLHFTHKFFCFFGLRKKSIGCKPAIVSSFLSSLFSVNPLSRNRFTSSAHRNSVRFKNLSNNSSVVSTDRLHDESIRSFLDHVPLIELLFSARNRLRCFHIEGTL